MSNSLGIVALFYSVVTTVFAYDPFSGMPIYDCLTERPGVCPCDRTLLDVYKESDLYEEDDLANEPDTRLYLYTRKNREQPEFLHKCGEDIPKKSFFQPEKNIIVIVPNYLESVCFDAIFREMKDQYLAKEDCNVILLDWIWCNGPDYFSAVRSHKVVAIMLAIYLSNISSGEKKVPNWKIHIIGSGVGAHIAGVAGKKFYELTEKKVRRITGLDPAAPGFMEHRENTELRLHYSDAELVDAIHTDYMTDCLPNFGIGAPIAMADFYPNPDELQLSCIPYTLDSFLKGDWYYAILSLQPFFCSHLQSYQYYKDSINACDCQFVAVACSGKEDFDAGNCNDCGDNGEKCAVMGADFEYFPWDKESEVFVLRTVMECPYCNNDDINLNGFKLKPSDDENKDIVSTCFDPSNKPEDEPDENSHLECDDDSKPKKKCCCKCCKKPK